MNRIGKIIFMEKEIIKRKDEIGLFQGIKEKNLFFFKERIIEENIKRI